MRMPPLRRRDRPALFVDVAAGEVVLLVKVVVDDAVYGVELPQRPYAVEAKHDVRSPSKLQTRAIGVCAHQPTLALAPLRVADDPPGGAIGWQTIHDHPVRAPPSLHQPLRDALRRIPIASLGGKYPKTFPLVIRNHKRARTRANYRRPGRCSASGGAMTADFLRFAPMHSGMLIRAPGCLPRSPAISHGDRNVICSSFRYHQKHDQYRRL